MVAVLLSGRGKDVSVRVGLLLTVMSCSDVADLREG